jgi:hypothetical protein
MGAEAFATAWAEGAALSPEQAIAEALNFEQVSAAAPDKRDPGAGADRPPAETLIHSEVTVGR